MSLAGVPLSTSHVVHAHNVALAMQHLQAKLTPEQCDEHHERLQKGQHMQ